MSCDYKECDSSAVSRRLCGRHYMQVKRAGELHLWGLKPPQDPHIRFLRKVKVSEDKACWEWSGHVARNGYGFFSKSHTEPVGAHRYMYELMKAPLQEGMHIHHVCENRKCVNPGHLEQVTPLENLMASDTATRRNARKTHCKHGHEFSPENTRYCGPDKRHRECRTCRRATDKRFRERKRASHGS